MADYPIPTKTYTWATGGTATAPSLGKQTAGWAVGERPAAENVNWLYQANGEWSVYLNYVFYDANTDLDGSATETGPGLYLGANRDAAFFVAQTSVAGDFALVRVLSDNFAELVLQPDTLRADKVQIGDPNDASAGGALVVSDTTRLQPAAVARLISETSPAVVAVMEADAFSVRSDASVEDVGDALGRHNVITRQNYVKAFVTFRFTRNSAGPTSVVTVIDQYNVASVTDLGTGAFEVQLSDFDTAEGLASTYSVQTYASTGDSVRAVGVASSPAPTYTAATGKFTMHLRGESAGTWIVFGNAVVHDAYITATLY